MPWACNGAPSGPAYCHACGGVRPAAPGSIHLLRRRRASTLSPALSASPCGLLLPFSAAVSLVVGGVYQRGVKPVKVKRGPEPCPHAFARAT